MGINLQLLSLRIELSQRTELPKRVGLYARIGRAALKGRGFSRAVSTAYELRL